MQIKVKGYRYLMETYLFIGTVLPERAVLTLQFSVQFTHYVSRAQGVARISILLNQVAVRVETEEDWDLFDIRNLVKSIVQDNLDMLGYVTGNAYHLEISRVLCQNRNIDYVFGIDIPCIAQREKSGELAEILERLRSISSGDCGIYMRRCFSDLVSAMKYADDTGFYCYRAVESLRHHCAATQNAKNHEKEYDIKDNKKLQWEKFREVSGVDVEILKYLSGASRPNRHGDFSSLTSEERKKLFNTTWDVVDKYIKWVKTINPD